MANRFVIDFQNMPKVSVLGKTSTGQGSTFVGERITCSLVTKKTGTVGVLLPDLYGEFFSEVIRGVDLGARRDGYHILVSSSHSDRSEVEAVLRTLRGRIDGLIVMSPERGSRR